MKYRIGLDIGIASIGFAVIETDNEGEPLRIEKLGVRIFEKAENPKDGASLAMPRRIARGTRRTIRRRQHRVERTKSILAKTFGEQVIEEIERDKKDIYEIRKIALDEKITPADLGKLLLYFVKHRGFLSNRKAESKEKESGKLLNSTIKNREYLSNSKYRTIGEMIYLDSKYWNTKNGVKEYHTRNKEESYDNTFLRDDLLKELIMILGKQQSYGYITNEFAEKFTSKDGIFYRNRNFDEGPGTPSKFRGGYKVGLCPFEKEELRGAKASYTIEYNNALQKVNNLRIKSKGEERQLTTAERQEIIALIREKEEIKYSQLRKILGIDEGCIFNLINYSGAKGIAETEKAVFVSMRKSYGIRKKLSEVNKEAVEVIDRISYILSMYKADDNRRKELSSIEQLSSEEIENLLELNCKGFGGVSIKFAKKIQPYLEQGNKYNIACELAGYDHRLHTVSDKLYKLSSKEIYEQVGEITSPVVKRSVSQTIKVINAIIDKYGSPIAVNIELAREMSKSFDERRRIKKENDASFERNEQIKQKIQNEFGILSPNGQDVLKYLLYEEQGGKSAYSQKVIDCSKLFEPNYVQIDHIVPYSKSFDDSINNKVLVFTQENQEKRNRLPYEYFGQEKRWIDFENYVSSQNFPRKKVELLLKKKFTVEDEKEWKERNLNDTKYITRFIYNLIADNLQFEPSKKIKKVHAVNGRITSYARKLWGLTKCREEGDKHHALDAAVIACISDGAIQKITSFNKGKELMIRVGDRFVDNDGVCLTEEEYDREFGKKLKEPYQNFAKELELRLDNEPKIDENLFAKLGYSDEQIKGLTPVFVSRMVNRKVKGQIHDQTIRSAKIFKEKGEVISKVPLVKLRLTKDNQGIEGYYRPVDDKLLYNRLLKMLQNANGDAESAFKEVVYKPKSDGSDGAIVKKVKIVEKQTDGKIFENINGIAGNGSMARIDVFSKQGKFYAVPVYLKDVYSNTLPNKASTAGKKYSDWREMDESYEFLFSLYKNDLVYIKHKNGIELSKTNSKDKNNKLCLKEGFFYYNSFDISSASVALSNHDDSFKIKGLGIQGLDIFQKCSVDLMGNISFIHKEKREDFSHFGKRKCHS